jgi:hypothetical protein
MRENATYGGHMELSAFAHMTGRDVKVIQPGLVYVIDGNAGGRVEGDDTDQQAESSSTPMKTSRRPTKSKEVKEERRIKLGKGYYVYEDLTSEEEDAAKVKMEEVEGTLEDENPTIYVA